jgi:O-antigen/teichoic acid export membrane protein
MTEAAEGYFEDHRATTDLGRLALRGGIVSVAMQYVNGALQIAAVIILARLLAPEDFGLVAIVTVLTSFAPAVIDFGLGDDEVRSIIRFGLHVVAFSATYTFARAVDRIGLGLFYRPDTVGYYQNATAFYENSIISTHLQLHKVGSASLSKLQSDPAALRHKYETALSAVAFFAMPMAGILSVMAEDLTVLLLGEKWRAGGLLLSIIALRGIFQVVEGSQGWLHLSIGTADRWQNWGIVSLCVQVAAVLGGLPFDATGVATASVIASLLIAVPSVNYAGRPIGVHAALVMRAVGPQLIGAISMVAAGWCMELTVLAGYASFIRMLLSGAFCCGAFSAYGAG